jgi:DNA-binding response OmpR family regulator
MVKKKMQKNNGKKKKILVIDDDEGIIQAFQVILDMSGFDVQTSMSPEIINSLTKKNLPDLILLDVLLSGSDGRDICYQLKHQALTKHIPIIMVSAHPSAGRSIKQMGADDFLAKPFEMKDLISKIELYTNKYVRKKITRNS